MKPIVLGLLTLLLLSVNFGKANAADATMVVVPNPFCTQAEIRFELPGNDTVSLALYSIYGDVVRTCFADTFLVAGAHSVNISGDSLNTGPYLAGLSYSDTLKIFTRFVKMNCTPTAVPEIQLPFNLHLFPNPTTGLLHIPYAGGKTVLIVDQTGAVCTTIKTQDTEISVAALPAGTYIASIYRDDKTLLGTGKFIKW